MSKKNKRKVHKAHPLDPRDAAAIDTYERERVVERLANAAEAVLFLQEDKLGEHHEELRAAWQGYVDYVEANPAIQAFIQAEYDDERSAAALAALAVRVEALESEVIRRVTGNPPVPSDHDRRMASLRDTKERLIQSQDSWKDWRTSVVERERNSLGDPEPLLYEQVMGRDEEWIPNPVPEETAMDAADFLETDGQLLDRLGTDARNWAEEFMKLRGTMVDEGLMLTWFANAIESGRRDGAEKTAIGYERAWAQDEQSKPVVRQYADTHTWDEWKAVLGQHLDTAFRKSGDSVEANVAHQYINAMTAADWDSVLYFVVDGLENAGWIDVRHGEPS